MGKTRTRAYAIALVTMMSAPIALASGQDAAVTEIKVVSTVPQGFDLAADRGKSVYIEFVGSKRLTDELRASFMAAGYLVENAKDSAAVRYELDGAYQALRPGTGRTAEIRAGDYAEDPKSLKTTTGRGASVMVSFNPLVMLFGTIFSNVGDRTGGRDAMNENTTGDPDGKCLANCKGWLYRQRAVVNIARLEGNSTQRATATSSTETASLEPSALFAKAAEELTKAAGLPAFGIK